MATNHTPNFGLCQWEANDAVLREDFNADNLVLDAALQGLKTAPCCVTGTYLGGTDPNKVEVNVGFRPSFLVIVSDRSSQDDRYNMDQMSVLAFTGCYLTILRSSSNTSKATDIFTDTGFTLEAVSTNKHSLNAKGIPFHYAAFY